MLENKVFVTKELPDRSLQWTLQDVEIDFGCHNAFNEMQFPHTMTRKTPPDINCVIVLDSSLYLKRNDSILGRDINSLSLAISEAERRLIRPKNLCPLLFSPILMIFTPL